MAPPDPARRSAASQQAILEATRTLMVEVGFVRLTIEAIAARAGVGKQTIYRWWPSKSAVVCDAILAAQAGEDGSHALPDTGDVVADLRGVLRGVVAELNDPETDRLQRTITAEVQHDTDLAHDIAERLLRPQMEATAQRLRAAQMAGQLDARADPAMVAEMLFGPILHRWLLRTAPLEVAYADRLIDQLMAGLAPA